jgi:hypothetical protein
MDGRSCAKNLRLEGVQWQLPATVSPRPIRLVAEDGGNEMAKGQAKKEKTNKPKLSAKQKKANKATKKATKAAK